LVGGHPAPAVEIHDGILVKVANQQQDLRDSHVLILVYEADSAIKWRHSSEKSTAL